MDCVKALLKQEGIDIYKESFYGDTPFHWAASCYDGVEYLKLLINFAGPHYFNKKNDRGYTAYDYACIYRITENIDILAPYNRY